MVEATWDDPERDAEIGRKFNLWSAGCRANLRSRHRTPPVVLGLPDVLSRLTTDQSERWGTLSYTQKQILQLARRTLFELRMAEATRRVRF